MDSSYSANRNFLDEIRLTQGDDELRGFFHRLLAYDREKALELINAGNLTFKSLFVLRHEIEKSNLYTHLNIRNNNALNIANKILNRKTADGSRISSFPQPELRWILDTGYPNERMDSEYDEILEFSAILLIKLHKDKTRLNAVTGMIFDRHRKGLPVYDLVWALFESCEPRCLLLIADYLGSGYEPDTELARKLLDFAPCMQVNRNVDGKTQQSYFLNWFYDNLPFLYYTGESFHQTSAPIPYAVCRDAKYLCKSVSPENGNPLRSYSEIEKALLGKFGKLDIVTKERLADYSFRLYRRNTNLWIQWMRYPIAEQMRFAGLPAGGLP